MDNQAVAIRHPDILRAESAVLLVVDIQERLVPAIHQGQRVIDETMRLIKGCRVLNVPMIATEQYPQGIGPLVPAIRDLLDSEMILPKMTFSVCGDEEAAQLLETQGRNQVILAGIETHVCIVQTALDLLEQEYQVYVPIETVSSRRAECREAALMRMREAGVVVTTIESALFEMLVRADIPQFKEILKIVR